MSYAAQTLITERIGSRKRVWAGTIREAGQGSKSWVGGEKARMNQRWAVLGELADRHTQQVIHDGRVVPSSLLPSLPFLPSSLHSVNVYQRPPTELDPGHAKTRKA